MHSKFTVLYGVVENLRKAQQLPLDCSEQEAVMEKVRQQKFGQGGFALEAVFSTIFGYKPTLAESVQWKAISHFVNTYNNLKNSGKISRGTEAIYGMMMGEPRDLLLDDTVFFKEYFQDHEHILTSDINLLESEIYRAELTLCEIGAEFCLTIPGEHDELEDGKFVRTDQDGKLKDSPYDDFWKTMLDKESPLNPLDLSARALGHYAAYRLRTNRFRYLTQSFHGLNEDELAAIPVRYGALDVTAILEWLFGKEDFTSYKKISLPDMATDSEDKSAQEKLKILSLPDSTTLQIAYSKLKVSVDESCNEKDHQCWRGLLGLEFGEKLGSAAEMPTYCDVVFNDPYTALQRKLNNALIEVSNQFLKDWVAAP